MFVIMYMAFGMVIEEPCPSPLLFFCYYYFVVPFGTNLNDDENIGILVSLHHVLFGLFCLFFVNQNGMVLWIVSKVFEYKII